MRATLIACGTRHESVPAGSVAASMPPHGSHAARTHSRRFYVAPGDEPDTALPSSRQHSRRL
ncbi:hypothetical protein XANMN_14265 [Xanthomonas phaseoli pv. manihotis str. CIO151]|nr:hypothetical protein XANMN_14265 [Xanthomonas phaseoli pv. manihotis str. CIO151]